MFVEGINEVNRALLLCSADGGDTTHRKEKKKKKKKCYPVNIIIMHYRKRTISSPGDRVGIYSKQYCV